MPSAWQFAELRHAIRARFADLADESFIAAGMGISILPDTYMKTGIPGEDYRELGAGTALSRHRPGRAVTQAAAACGSARRAGLSPGVR
ncbi:MAG TPA: hypothetical protein DCR74_13000 [Achromobacter sp.]|nr:hypothetical protein [Achromobacter sp.]